MVESRTLDGVSLHTQQNVNHGSLQEHANLKASYELMKQAQQVVSYQDLGSDRILFVVLVVYVSLQDCDAVDAVEMFSMDASHISRAKDVQRRQQSSNQRACEQLLDGSYDCHRR